jgi:hypothetical protein
MGIVLFFLVAAGLVVGAGVYQSKARKYECLYLSQVDKWREVKWNGQCIGIDADGNLVERQ